jgi:serine protease inhibitor
MRSLTIEGSTKEFLFRNNLYAFFSDTLPFNERAFTNLQTTAANTCGAQITTMDFSQSEQAAARINALVHQDTNGKISTLVQPGNFNALTAVVFLHTMYIKATWLFYPDESRIVFNDGKNSKSVASFRDSSEFFKVYDADGAVFLALPAMENTTVLIRHHTSNVRPITAADLDTFNRSSRESLVNFNIPCVSMKTEHDLQELLKNELPLSLTRAFETQISNLPLLITKYIQKVTLDMNETGLEASAATAMVEMIGSMNMTKPREIIVNSPFSLAVLKKVQGQDIPLFYGQVTDFSSLTISGKATGGHLATFWGFEYDEDLCIK